MSQIVFEFTDVELSLLAQTLSAANIGVISGKIVDRDVINLLDKLKKSTTFQETLDEVTEALQGAGFLDLLEELEEGEDNER